MRRSSPRVFRPKPGMAESSLVPFTPRLLQLLQQHRPPRSSASASAAEKGAVESPLRLSLPSALLFIDVTGFTSLTESMSQRGASGLEQLTAILNAFFSSILAVIDQHRGDLLKVAGDALIVAFYDEQAAHTAALSLFPQPQPHNPLPSSIAHADDPSSSVDVLPLLTLRALHAALALLAALAADGSLPLRLHIGATCGLTDYIVVGGAEQFWAVGGFAADIIQLDSEMSTTSQAASAGISSPHEAPLSTATEPPSPSTCSTAASPRSAHAGSRSSSALSHFSYPSSVPASAEEPASPASPPLLTPADSSDQSLLSRSRPRPLLLPRLSSDHFLFSTRRAGGSRWEFLAVGPAFDDLNSAVSDSRTGEVVCSGQLWTLAAELAELEGVQLRNGTGNWRVLACTPKKSALVEVVGKVDDLDVARVADLALSSRLPAKLSIDGASGSRSPEQAAPASTHLQSPLVSFVMPALLSRLHTGLSTPSHWLGEYRRLTVLFISLPNPLDCHPPASRPPQPQQPTTAASGQPQDTSSAFPSPISHAPPLPMPIPSSSSSSSSPSFSSAVSSSTGVPAWLERFHAVVRTMQRSIFTLGGQVRQLLVDDKGCALIVAFGLPPLAQEDDAARALVTALDILASVRTQHPQVVKAVSIGATTGRAWCGAVGSSSRKEYALVGDIVNLSARIMGNPVTRGRVMCDEETVKACGGRVEFSPTTREVSVKGRAGLVTLYEPIGKARLSFSAPSTGPSRAESPAMAHQSPAALFSAASRSLSRSLSRSTGSVNHSPATPSRDWSKGFATQMADTASTMHSRELALHRIASLLIHSVSPVSVEKAVGVDAEASDAPVATPASAPVVLLEGGAGQGKTYLTCQVVEHCRASGLVVLIGAADSIEANTPFFAIALVLQDIVRMELIRLQQLEVEEAGDAAEAEVVPLSAHAALLAMLPEADRRYVSLLYPFLPEVAADEMAESAIVEVSMRPVFTRRLMRALLLAHCRIHPSTLVLIEDGHWMDLQGWTLLRELTEHVPSFRLMVTCRPIPAPDVVGPAALSSPNSSLWTMYAAVTEHPRCRHIVLQGVDATTSSALAVSFLACRSLHPQLAAVIHQRSDGVPLFIQHLCSYLRESSLVSVTAAGMASLDELLLANVALPSSLEGLLASVLDRLHPDCQLTLKVASVVGRHFSLSVVAACHPLAVSRAWLQSMMALAEQQRIVERQSRAEGDWGQVQGDQPRGEREESEEDDEELDGELRHDLHYRFTHQLVRDAAYSSLLYQQRRDLHAKVADHFHQLSGRQRGDLSPSSPQLLQSAASVAATGRRSASSQLLAHHYFLSVCSSGNSITEHPVQRQLECAVQYLLETANYSRQLGAMDAVGLLLCLAARGLRRLQDEDKRDVLQVRWLYLVLGSEILYNLPLVTMLAVELGDASSTEGGANAVGNRCLRTFAQRLISLLTSPSVVRDLRTLQAQGTPHSHTHAHAPHTGLCSR